jgi:hypothetical protein
MRLINLKITKASLGGPVSSSLACHECQTYTLDRINFQFVKNVGLTPLIFHAAMKFFAGDEG